MTDTHPTSLQPRLRLSYAALYLSILTILIATNTVRANDALSETRNRMLQQFDINNNGRLDAEERNTMRLATREKKLKGGGGGVPQSILDDYDTNKDGDMDEGEWNDARIAEQVILTKQFDTDDDGELNDQEKTLMMVNIRTVPTRYARDYFAYLIVYDNNGNGEFDGDEYQLAQAAEAKAFVAVYDASGDGELDKEEISRLQSDMKNGKIVGFAIRFASDLAGGGGKRANRGGGHLEEQRRLLAYDTDGDGLADADELAAIRKARID